MINLELLELVTFAIAVLALWRMRPATLMIAGNQLVTLRALSGIRDFGQPVEQSQNPADLFSLDRIATASHLFALSTAILLVMVLIKPRRQTTTPPVLPAVPRWVLALILLFAVVAATTTRTILQLGRADPDRAISIFGATLTMSGLAPMLYSVLFYELYRRVVIGRLRARWAFLAIVVLFTATDYLQGQTGLASGYIACAAILFFGAAATRLTNAKRAAIGMLILAAALVSATVRHVRQDIWREGWRSVESFSDALLSEEPLRAQTGAGLESEGNGTAYAAHVLEGIALYDGGQSRHWQSFLDPVINTLEPSFLVEWMGATRPVTAAVELQKYFVSLGGSYLLGELYWNGGYPCVALGFFLIALWAFLCDTRYRRSALWLMLTCQFAPALLEAVGYGLTHTFRCWFDGFLVIAAYRAMLGFKRSVFARKRAPQVSPLRLRLAPTVARRPE